MIPERPNTLGSFLLQIIDSMYRFIAEIIQSVVYQRNIAVPWKSAMASLMDPQIMPGPTGVMSNLDTPPSRAIDWRQGQSH